MFDRLTVAPTAAAPPGSVILATTVLVIGVTGAAGAGVVTVGVGVGVGVVVFGVVVFGVVVTFGAVVVVVGTAEMVKLALLDDEKMSVMVKPSVALTEPPLIVIEAVPALDPLTLRV